MRDAEYPRGMLSPADREYLLGSSDIEAESQTERNIRARIRERVRAGLRDFSFLADSQYFEDRDLKQVREHRDDDMEELKARADRMPIEISYESLLTEELERDIIEMIAFLYRLQPNSNHLEGLIQSGIMRGLERQPSDATVSEVQITIEDPDTIAERIIYSLNNGVPLTESEIRIAHEHEIRPAEEIAQHVREHGTRLEGSSLELSTSRIRDELQKQDINRLSQEQDVDE